MKVSTDSMLLGALINVTERKTGLDIGTGTGVLSLMVAQRNPKISIQAVEIDEPSAELCKKNFHASEWSDRLKVHVGDIREFSFSEKFDLIFTNPPFYQNSLSSPVERISKAKHAAYLPTSELMKIVGELLTEEGVFWIIFPSEDKSLIIQTAELNGLFVKTDCSVNGKPFVPVRCIMEFSKTKPEEIVHQILTIREEDGNYTEQYKELTRDYHGKSLS